MTWRISSGVDRLPSHMTYVSKRSPCEVGASELMTLYPAIRSFVKEAFAKSTMVVDEVNSFLKLCEVCDLLQDARHCRTEARAHEIADRLEVAVPTYLAAFLKAYGLDAVRFKHHQMMHVAEQVRTDLLLLCCWVLERKHISAKQCFAHFYNKTVMPGGALARMVNHQAHLVQCRTQKAVSTAVNVALALVCSGVDRFSLGIHTYIYIYVYV